MLPDFDKGAHRRITETWPLLALCLVVGSRWALEQVEPAAVSSDLSAMAGCFVAALLCFLHRRLAGGHKNSILHRIAWKPAIGGGLVLASINLGLAVADRRVHGGDAVLALALSAPLLAVSLANAGQEDLTEALWPGLVGFGGLLLLLPQPAMDNLRYDLALCLLPVITSVGLLLAGKSEASCRPVSSVSLQAFQLFCGGALLSALCLLSMVRGATFPCSFVAVLLDAVVAWLTVLALSRIRAMAFVTKFLLAPLVTTLEGIVLLRQPMDPRFSIGFLLVFLGGMSPLLSLKERALPFSLKD